MKNECSSTTGSCETTTPSAQDCCPTQSACGCPIEAAKTLWTQSFFQALKEAQKDALKAKIQKAWGSKIDKAADAVLEAMDAKWKSALSQGKAEIDLKDRLASIYTEGK